jgi:hypothetical protein
VEIAKKGRNNIVNRSLDDLNRFTITLFDPRKLEFGSAPLFEGLVDGGGKVIDYVKSTVLLILAIILIYYVIQLILLLFELFFL